MHPSAELATVAVFAPAGPKKKGIKKKKVIVSRPPPPPSPLLLINDETPIEFNISLGDDDNSIEYLNRGEKIIDDVLPKNTSKLARRVYQHLKSLNIEPTREQRFPECKYKISLPFDFVIYIPDKICKIGIIEADGQQHFAENAFFHKEGDFEEQKQKDKIKNRFTREKGISLLRISDRDIENCENLLNQFIQKMKKSDMRIDLFSNTDQYVNPYGDQISGGCSIM